jgi:hypothetical protein
MALLREGIGKRIAVKPGEDGGYLSAKGTSIALADLTNL